MALVVPKFLQISFFVLIFPLILILCMLRSYWLLPTWRQQ